MDTKTISYIVAQIEAIQQELEQLRRILIHQEEESKQKTKLKGLWKDIKVTEEDIAEAKRAVFRDAY
jgi:peptidoglycan hydrolase CwlO-like protein